MKGWGKKGQFFIIAAVIMILVIFTVTRKYNTIKQQVTLEDFNELSEGHRSESPIVINSALFRGGDPVTDLANFSEQYVGFARTLEPSYGVFYAYVDSQDRIHIKNHLNDRVIVVEGKTVTGSAIDIRLYALGAPAPGLVTLNIGGTRLGTTVRGQLSDYGVFSQASLSGVRELELRVDGTPFRILAEGFIGGSYTATNIATNCPPGSSRQDCTIRVSVL